MTEAEWLAWGLPVAGALVVGGLIGALVGWIVQRVVGEGGVLAALWTTLAVVLVKGGDVVTLAPDRSLALYGTGLVAIALPGAGRRVRETLGALPWSHLEALVREVLPARVAADVGEGARRALAGVVDAIVAVLLLLVIAAGLGMDGLADAVGDLVGLLVGVVSALLVVGVGVATLGAWRRQGGDGVAVLGVGALAALAVAQALPAGVFVVAALIVGLSVPRGASTLQDLLAGVELRERARAGAVLVQLDERLLEVREVGALASACEGPDGAEEVVANHLLARALPVRGTAPPAPPAAPR